MGVQNPVCEPATTGNLGPAYQLLPGVVGLEPVCLRAAEQHSYKASSTLPGQLQLSVPYNEGNRGVEADKRSFQSQCLHVLPSCVMETPRAILGALQTGQWVTSLDLKDPYFHIGIHQVNRHSLHFCQNGPAWQFTVLSCGLSISPRVFTKILRPVLACAKILICMGSSYIICNWTTQRIIIIELI